MGNGLKAVLFDFNGVIINDEPLHQELIAQLLIEENLRPKPEEYWELCVGRSDRACLTDLFARRGRVLSDDYLNALVARKSKAYQDKLATLEKLPIYPGVSDLVFKLRAAQIPIGVVSGAVRAEIELVLTRAGLIDHVSVIVAGDDINASKPDPDGYLLAVDKLSNDASVMLQPSNCLAIEDTPAGITAAKKAGMSVVGIANTYPFHMMQRQANWAVDYLSELELDRIRHFFAKQTERELSQP